MGCASSRRIEATIDTYRPAPASFAVFDINAIEEPWLKLNHSSLAHDHHQKPNHGHVPPPLLHKLNMLEATEAPQSWAELSKALEDLKPTLVTAAKPPSASPAPAPQPADAPQTKTLVSIHTVEEIDAKAKSEELAKTATQSESELIRDKSDSEAATEVEGGGCKIKPVKDNIFIVRDRLEGEKEGKMSNYDRIASLKRDPLSEYPEKCPPGGADVVVIYTTSLGGVRKTFEECNKVREVLEGHEVVFDERDVSLHGEFLKQLKELMGEGEGEGERVKVPRVFVKGRYVGGVEQLLELNESGRLARILKAARVERGLGRQGCGGCGGARFVPCLECGGSCKLVVGAQNQKERCPKCNENGLMHCPACVSL